MEAALDTDRYLSSSVGKARKDPRRYWIDLDQARADFHQGELGQAEESVNGLLTQIEGETGEAVAGLRGSAYTLLGRIREAREEDDDALRDFRQAVRWFDRELSAAQDLSGRVYSDYGRALYKVKGRDQDAKDNLERALDLHYTHASTYRYLGYTLLRLGASHEAEEKLRLALELAPGNPAALRALADCLERRDRPAEAAAVLEDLAWLLVSANEPEEAVAEGERALALSPSTTRKAELGSLLRLAGRDEEAVEHLRAALEDEPQLAWAHTELGEAWRALGRLDEALEELDRALGLEPDDVFTLAQKAETLTLLDRSREALATLERILELQPENTFALGRKALTLHLMGFGHEALEALERVLASDPHDAFALATKGMILGERGEGEASVELLKRATASDPKAAWMHVELGKALSGLNRHDEALKAMENALELEPGNALALFHKGDTLRMSGRPEEALEALERLLELAPENVAALVREGQILHSVGDHERALKVLERALELEPGNASALAHKGDVLHSLSRLDEALEVLERALEAKPDDAFALSRKGDTLRMLDRLDEALEMLDRALELRRDDPFTLASRGEVLRLQGRGKEALTSLERAIELKPSYAFALATKAQVRYDSGEFEEAETLLRSVLENEETERDPDMAWVHSGLALVLWQQGDYEKALATFERSLELQPADPSVLGLKGELLKTLDRYEEAMAALDTALELEPDNLVALGGKGRLLIDCAEYREGYRILERATKLEPDNLQCLESKAFALLFLEPRFDREQLERGEEACRALQELDPEEPSHHALRGDFLYRQDRKKEAAREYRWVTEHGEREGPALDVETLAAVGWSHYRLGSYDRAVHHLVTAVRNGTGMTSVQFDLALTLIASGREELALQEYDRGIEMARTAHPLRRRGLYHVALADLEEEAVNNPELGDREHFRQAREKLETACAEVEGALGE